MALTFVCCIEHGRLEEQTLMMVKSLRRFGGAFANAPVIAVIGRTGAALRARTLEELIQLGVRIERAKRRNPAPWFNYANKIVAVQVAEEIALTEQVAWLDSDVLVAGDLAGLALMPHETFAARGEWLPPAMFENDPSSAEHLPYWEQLCRLLETQVEALPWLEAEPGKPRMRMYFNSGVFVWRRGCGFALAYGNAFCKLIASRLAQKDNNFFSADQVILSPIIVRHGFAWRHLDQRHHHMTFHGFIDGPGASPTMREASIIHYSQSMNPPYRDRFLRRLDMEKAELAAFVREEQGRPALPPPSLLDAALARLLRVVRGARWRHYASRVTQVLATDKR